MAALSRRGSTSKIPAILLGMLSYVALAVSGCLKLNADYQAIEQAQSKDPASSTTEQAIPPTQTTLDDDETSSASTAKDTSSTTEPDPNSSNDSTSSATDSGSSNTGTDTRTEYPVDTNDGVWTPFTVSLSSSATTPRLSGYAMQVFVAHDAIVASGGDPQGNDLAIVYVDQGIGKSLHRWRDPHTTWNDRETRLWFNTQENINPGQSQTGRYYLVRGSSVFKPKDDPNQIFLVHDDFQGGTVDTQRWQDIDEATGNSEIAATLDGISFRVSAPDAQVQRRSLVSLWNQTHSGVLAEARLRIPSSVNLNCSRMVPLAFETSSDNRIWHGLGFDPRRWRRAVYSSVRDEVEFNTMTDTLPDENASWHRYAITWHENKAGIWRDGRLIDWINSLTQGVSRPSERPIRLRLSSQARGGGCVGATQSEVEFDWIWLRTYADPEPKAAF